jgi:hypothetical protein
MDDLTESKLQAAYELIKAGQIDQAHEILIPMLRADPNLADGWFLLGHATNNSLEKIRCFQQVLRLEPDNEAAQKQLTRLLASQGTSSSKTKTLSAKKSATKKRSPVLLWGLVGLLFIGLSILGVLWGFKNSISPLSALAPVIQNSATPEQPTVTLVVPTLKPSATIPTRATSRPTITLPPTLTPQPSVTAIPTLTLTFTIMPSPVIPKPSSKMPTVCVAPNGLGNLTAPFKIENFGKEKSIIYLNGMSQNGNNPVNCQITVKQGIPITIELAFGNYDYIVLRGGTVRRGSFVVDAPTKATMQIFADKIRIGEFP